MGVALQGIFVLPFLINATVAYVAAPGVSARARLAGTAAAYVASAISIFAYQAVVSGAPNLVYAVVAPLLPAVILWAVMPRKREDSEKSGISQEEGAESLASSGSGDRRE